MQKNIWKNNAYLCIDESLLYSRGQDNTVNQLHFSKKKYYLGN